MQGTTVAHEDGRRQGWNSPATRTQDAELGKGNECSGLLGKVRAAELDFGLVQDLVTHDQSGDIAERSGLGQAALGELLFGKGI